MSKAETTRSVLSELIRIHNDRIELYLNAGGQLKNNQPDIHLLIDDLIGLGRQHKSEIAAYLRDNADKVEGSVDLTDAVYNNWIDVKDKITDVGRETLLKRCSKVEEGTRKAYKQALGVLKLAPGVHEMIVLHMQAMEASRDKLDRLLTALPG